MGQKRRFIPFMLVMILALTACSDPVGEELVDYLNNEYAEFTVLDQQLDESYGNYEMVGEAGSEEQMYEIHQDQLKPLTEDIYELLTSIEFEHEEVEYLNQLLIEETTHKKEALEAEEEGFEMAFDDGESLDDEAREKFAERDRLYEETYVKTEEFLEKFDEMIEEYNIEIEEQVRDESQTERQELRDEDIDD